MTRTVKKTPANANKKASAAKKKRAVKKKVAPKKAAKPALKKAKPVSKKKIVKAAIKKTAPKKTVKKSVKKRIKKAPPKKILSNAAQTPARESAPQTAPHQAASYDAMKQTIKEMTMTQNTKQFEQFSQNAASTSREGVEAFIQSQTIFKKGMEEIFRAGMSFAQMSAEKQAKYVQEAMGAKTLNDFTEFQNKVAKENFDDFMSSATKISEMSTKMMAEASEPINAQMTKSVEAVQKATKAAA